MLKCGSDPIMANLLEMPRRLSATKRSSKADPWGGLFLKSDCIGFQISPTFGGREAPKGRCMKSALTDFITQLSNEL
jgi:hypothetical protein